MGILIPNIMVSCRFKTINQSAKNVLPESWNYLGLWSQPFSRSYGSILSTSLTYIFLESRGCSPWVPDAVIGTVKYS